ncbi:hypothetical protein B0F90DRAFT_1680930 [Multifurca ochricompacta]|uniref:TECPR1-like DysF domain-containing protein n=1 Tax=Multifurca ochricompacta TaxID=376703 RepID=A0AAD4ME73_9AGAM|nr:hypothetical protein B0F90DRAFT_1680930 [Multifurca ochricompacta]
MQVEPPPPTLEGSSISESVRRRLINNRQLILAIPRLPDLKAWRARRKSRPSEEQLILSNDMAEIDINVPRADLDFGQDVYRWAVVYENQRGITAFSTPYYSRLGLLPHDPPAFTIPEADGRRDRQPQVSLHDYPLPDGTWRWVSKTWMVDMRSEGEVHYDGFEYNWFFRRHKWRPEPGGFNAGGWVRRRRWVRLMMRPAYPTYQNQNGMKAVVWTGDSDDWKRCHRLMARLNRDGTKLELWREWLGIFPPTRQRKVWSEDDYFPLSEEANVDVARASVLGTGQREHLAAVVHDHIEDLIQLFIYPESRVEFLAILSAAGISVRRDCCRFWSYTRGYLVLNEMNIT